MTHPTTAEAKKTMKPEDNKFHKGAPDGKHYWLTPPELWKKLTERFGINFDPCPYPKPEDFDGLTSEWGSSSYVNPPFGSIMHQGKKKGATAWARKCIEEFRKGKRVVMVHPIDKWVLMMIEAGAKIENLGDVRWLATEDGSAGKGTGRHIAMFILDPQPPTEDKREYEISKAKDNLAMMQRLYEKRLADIARAYALLTEAVDQLENFNAIDKHIPTVQLITKINALLGE